FFAGIVHWPSSGALAAEARVGVALPGAGLAGVAAVDPAPRPAGSSPVPQATTRPSTTSRLVDRRRGVAVFDIERYAKRGRPV
ncbi:MAG: hypothetical protein K0S86_5228, partial [Geminicoccaceae bacterium]|nr:hypothetical protein [Geminicoccaceae bacterium]